MSPTWISEDKAPDLIDTLWNVKKFRIFFRIALSVDLIDTLWNVKVRISYDCAGQRLGFNRYIVECKEKTPQNTSAFSARFNRYIVECKVLLDIMVLGDRYWI